MHNGDDTLRRLQSPSVRIRIVGSQISKRVQYEGAK